MSSAPVRVRIAPSPTGYFHIGNARTALFNWLFARRHGGRFILRVEDTDRKRYVPDSLDHIMASLHWLGLDWDEGPEVGGPYGPYFQSQRLDLYRHWAAWLVEEGHAYRCYCSTERLEQLRKEQQARKEQPGYDRHCRFLSSEQRASREAAGDPSVVRLAVPLEGKTTFADAIRGDITFDHRLIQDAVLLKSDGWPTYHLAAVVDDHFMEISHIMRGDEWVSSVPLGILLYQAFGWEPPVWAHLPVILNPNGKGKMRKREIVNPDGTVIPVYVQDYQAQGYLPEAMFNFLANIGWSLDGSTEVFTRQKASSAFKIAGINPAPAAFPFEKLEWLNGVYIRQLGDEELYQRLVPFVARGLNKSEAELATRPELRAATPLIRERIRTLDEAAAAVDFFFAGEPLAYSDPAELVGPKMTGAQSAAALQATIDALGQLEPFDEASIETCLRDLTTRLGLKVRQLFSVIRVAVTGRHVSPPLFQTMAILGRERTLRRLADARDVLPQ